MRTMWNKLISSGAAAAAALCLGVSAQAQQIEITAAPGSRLVLSGKRHTIPLRVGLRGFKLVSERDRAPVNVAIVLDRSGSMSGEKLERAKEAAIMAVERLRADDIVALITYDDIIDVVVPATKVSDKDQIIRAIRSVGARGSTALFAGVSRGASEVRKFFEKNRVNRVILLSDGQANVGPSSPDELGSLGASLGREGVSVSTVGLGLGYNEDLMTRLAGRSDGNHFFAENSTDLTRVFARELGDILSVVARDVDIRITCPAGFRPLRVIGRHADIHGQTVVVPLSQVYADQEKYVMLEVEVPEGRAGETLEAAKVEVSYANLRSRRQDHITRAASIVFSDSADEVARSVDRAAMEAYYTQLTIDSNTRALALRDANKKAEAQELLRSNASVLSQKSVEYNIPSLNDTANQYQQQADSMDKMDWGKQRKVLSEYQYQKRNQMSK